MVCAGSVVLLGFARLFHARPLRLLRDKTLAADSLARMVCRTAVEACDLGGLNFLIAAGCSSKASDRSGSAGNFSCNLAECRTHAILATARWARPLSLVCRALGLGFDHYGLRGELDDAFGRKR